MRTITQRWSLIIRLAMTLSGAVIAGLALAPAVSAATVVRAHSMSSVAIRQAGVVPNVGDCHTYTDEATYAEGYCSLPPGDFFTYLVCNFGDNLRTIDGPVRVAGEGITSYARCPDDWTYYSAGTIPT